MSVNRPGKESSLNLEALHRPVLHNRVLDYLQPRSGGFYIDATLGLGGHTAAILKASAPDGAVLGLDQDRQALSLASRRLSAFSGRYQIAHASFADLAQVARQRHLQGCDGILFDLGVSSLQLDTPDRGFSFQRSGPLDMRMDSERALTAHEVVNCYSEKDLAHLIFQYGEEPMARRIARQVVKARPIQDTLHLAGLVSRAIPHKKSGRIHPATRTFQALRIFVNDELGSLAKGLKAAVDLLNPGGRIVVISFHSLEDRIVKETFRDLAVECICPPGLPVCVCGTRKKIILLTRRPVVPDWAEMAENPRARSAKLRAAERL